MNILCYTSGYDGCGYYRLTLPAKYLNKIPGIHVKISYQYSVEEIRWSDVVVIQKQSNQKALPFLKQAKQMGKKIISEVDDDYFHIDLSNPAYKYYYDKAQDLINFYKLSDAMTVTTDHLKKEMLAYNSNIFVLPNSLDIASQDKLLASPDRLKNTKYLDKKQKEIPKEEVAKLLEGKIKILWQGSPTHRIDLQQATPALHKICRENKNVILIMMACTTDTILNSTPEGQLILVAPVAIFNYHQVLSTIPADIGICPIHDIRFNYSKSNLKYLEQSINDMVVVCSNVENYKKTVIHGETGLLANNTEKDWYNKLNFLIENAEERKRMRENAKKFVIENYDMSKNVQLWLDCYNKVLNK